MEVKQATVYKINLREKNCDMKNGWIKDWQIQITKMTLFLTPNKSDILFPQNINYVHTYIHTHMLCRSTNSVI